MKASKNVGEPTPYYQKCRRPAHKEVGYSGFSRRPLVKISRLLAPCSLIVLFSFLYADTSPNDPKLRAAAALEQDVKADPGNSELWLHLAFAYRKDGQLERAQSAFEKAAALDPRSSDAFYMLGLIYESKHQSAQAQKAWQSYMATETDASKRAVAEKHIHHLAE
jgi:cytochrome c-type biogenesis protein CcmH/NrfG